MNVLWKRFYPGAFCLCSYLPPVEWLIQKIPGVFSAEMWPILRGKHLLQRLYKYDIRILFPRYGCHLFLVSHKTINRDSSTWWGNQWVFLGDQEEGIFLAQVHTRLILVKAFHRLAEATLQFTIERGPYTFWRPEKGESLALKDDQGYFTVLCKKLFKSIQCK